MTDVHLGIPEMPAPDYPSDVRARLEADAKELIGRYPDSRSALLPLLHLVQSEEGHVTRTGQRFCAEMLDLTTAEVAAVVTFYTMYRRKPGGDYQVGVCTNTLCAVMGGDAIFEELQEHLEVGNNETTEDGKVTLEHIECNAACDYAPVVMVNWEFFDNQTPDTAKRLVDDLRAGRDVRPTRGAKLCSFQETSRVLAGFPDERPGVVEESGGAGPASLAGLRLARGEAEAPARVVAPRNGEGTGAASRAEDSGAGGAEASGPGGTAPRTAEPPTTHPSSHDAPQPSAESDPENPTGPVTEEDQ